MFWKLFKCADTPVLKLQEALSTLTFQLNF